MNVGIVGATGIVGEVFMELLEERNFPLDELRLFASDASAGKTVRYKNEDITLRRLEKNCFDGLQLVFFSSGDPISLEWAPQAAESGAFAVDNSAAFRMDPQTLLIVPEVNGNLLPAADQPTIIANPNCSTIQLVVALKPLADQFGLKSVRVSSYQAASGAGKAAMAELKAQMQQALNDEKIEHHEFSAPLALNCIPQIGSIKEDGFSTEERKIIFETRKILDITNLNISAFTVRIPTLVGHAEAVWVELKNEAEETQFLSALESADGLELMREGYPMVADCRTKNPVFVGRVHRDLNDPYTWIMWVVADNLRKGAALNGIQIAEHIFDIKS